MVAGLPVSLVFQGPCLRTTWAWPSNLGQSTRRHESGCCSMLFLEVSFTPEVCFTRLRACQCAQDAAEALQVGVRPARPGLQGGRGGRDRADTARPRPHRRGARLGNLVGACSVGAPDSQGCAHVLPRPGTVVDCGARRDVRGWWVHVASELLIRRDAQRLVNMPSILPLTWNSGRLWCVLRDMPGGGRCEFMQAHGCI